MRVLLDTNIVIWIVTNGERISASARRVIDGASAVMVSSVTVWEIGIKVALGKLEIDMDSLLDDLLASGFERLPVTWEHGRAVRSLPHHHRDPFDRMLIAQAKSEPLQLLTSDKLLARYGDLVTVV